MESSAQTGKVREIARIRGFGDQKPTSVPCINVQRREGKPSVVISFSTEQSTSKPFNYEVDQCYDHEAGNDVVYSEEIKPLIASVFEGKSATVFAYGARGSGKTYTVQGSENVPGLINLSISEFVTRAEELGSVISISVYEVVQDRVLDLLDSKKPEISVLEGAHGKIVLKGLSKVTVKSMSDFDKLWCSISQKPLQKTTNEPPQRSHKGMIINISSPQQEASLLGRLNIVDLAGYEDKRQSTNLLGISKINKSLYAVHNVVHALKNNESRVPYRESKITRILQESLAGTSKILMITCMDPFFPEDTIKSLSLAARSGQVFNATKVDNTPRVKNSTKPYMTPTSSFKQSVTHSLKSAKVASVSASTRKQALSTFRTTERTPQTDKVQGRRLFEELKLVNTKKRTVSKKYMEDTESSREQEKKLNENNMEVTKSSREQDVGITPDIARLCLEKDSPEGKMCAAKATQSSMVVSANNEEISSVNLTQPQPQPYLIISSTEEETSYVTQPQPSPVISTTETSVCTPLMAQPVSEESSEEQNINPPISKTLADHQDLVAQDIAHADKENTSSSALNEAASPPLSARLQALSNHLKSLHASTPLNINAEPRNYDSSIKAKNKLSVDVLEQNTPVSQTSNISQYATSLMSPWERLKVQSSGMKNSLVDECLTFLNSASKEELKGLKGIGETRATYILQLRDESPEPFKSLDDLKDIGLSSKQIKGMMENLMS